MAREWRHCVIGHGLTGTAAAKYLAEQGEEVLLVGPSEASGALGACYDEGRIYRILDPRESWARLAERSIEHYAKISEESGIDFYAECGLLIFGVRSPFVVQTEAIAARMGTPLLRLSRDEIRGRYPWMGVPEATELGLLQTDRAGHLSPRKLCEAQLAIARKHGASYLDRTVTSVASVASGAGAGADAAGAAAKVVSAGGEEIRAANVLVAAGCYTTLLPLLPEAVVMTLTGSQALLVEVSEEAAEGLRGMPTMIYEDSDEKKCFYILPPIKYPDGKWLIKIGPSTAFSPRLTGREEVDAWFRRGHLDPEFEAVALDAFQGMFPHVAMQSRRPLLCITDSTPTQSAYIDRLAPGWGICTGGNGWAAKSSDAIGWLAAQMMANPPGFPDPLLPKKWFRAVTPQSLLPTSELTTALASVEACGQMMAMQVAEALSAVTQLVTVSPGLQLKAPELVEAFRLSLAGLWGEAPSVFCMRDPDSQAVWAPAHPFVALRVGDLLLLVVRGAYGGRGGAS